MGFKQSGKDNNTNIHGMDTASLVSRHKSHPKERNKIEYVLRKRGHIDRLTAND